jgi:hypothetical protein
MELTIHSCLVLRLRIMYFLAHHLATLLLKQTESKDQIFFHNIYSNNCITIFLFDNICTVYGEDLEITHVQYFLARGEDTNLMFSVSSTIHLRQYNKRCNI